jgi:SLOG cluster3 family
MIDVLLSASVPLPTRDRRFFDTADVLAIREAIKAVVEVVLPVGRITCGGHPAITPLLAVFARDAGMRPDGVTIYQSAYFPARTAPNLSEFVDVRIVPSVGRDRQASLTAMRKAMISSRPFEAAVVVGGMDGVMEEIDLFVLQHPQAVVLPLGSTGAAAKIILGGMQYDHQLATDLTYPSLLRRRLPLPKGPISAQP